MLTLKPQQFELGTCTGCRWTVLYSLREIQKMRRCFIYLFPRRHQTRCAGRYIWHHGYGMFYQCGQPWKCLCNNGSGRRNPRGEWHTLQIARRHLFGVSILTFMLSHYSSSLFVRIILAHARMFPRHALGYTAAPPSQWVHQQHGQKQQFFPSNDFSMDRRCSHRWQTHRKRDRQTVEMIPLSLLLRSKRKRHG